MRDNAILPPTASGDGAGARFVSTDGVRRWRWGALLCATAAFASLFRSMSRKDSRRICRKKILHFSTFLGGPSSRRHSEVTVESGGNFEDYKLAYIRFLSCHLFGPVNHGQNRKGWERSGEKGLIITDNQAFSPLLSQPFQVCP